MKETNMKKTNMKETNMKRFFRKVDVFIWKFCKVVL